MADSRIDIWNVLHDGTISAAAHNGDLVTIFVGIGYLRRRLQPLGDSLVVNLSGVTRCEFRHFDGETTPLPEVFHVGEPDILSTDSATLPVTINTTLGELILAFSG